MNLAEFFRSIGAPLKNIQWSWGAVADGSHPKVPKGTVVLRVGETCFTQFDGVRYYQLIGPGWAPRSPGKPERARHIEAIRKGAPCMFILIKLKDDAGRRGNLESFNPTLFKVNSHLDLDGILYVGVK